MKCVCSFLNAFQRFISLFFRQQKDPKNNTIPVARETKKGQFQNESEVSWEIGVNRDTSFRVKTIYRLEDSLHCTSGFPHMFSVSVNITASSSPSAKLRARTFLAQVTISGYLRINTPVNQTSWLGF